MTKYLIALLLTSAACGTKTAPKQPAPPATEEKKPDDKTPTNEQRTKAAPTTAPGDPCDGGENKKK